MFADVSGSSALYKQLGDERARPLVREAVARMERAVTKHAGRVIKTIGDEVMASFPTGDNAIACAMEMQRDALQPLDGQLLPLRIGVNLGEAFLEGGDVFGEAVNDAAALVKIARARQIITGESTASQLHPAHRRLLSLFDRVALKGGREVENILLVNWEEETLSNATLIMGALPSQSGLALPLLTLRWPGGELDCTPANAPLAIGRDRQRCKVHIPSPQASRDHCAIEFRRGKFVLVDHSTNGTYVRLASGREVYLRREELPLVGSGSIGVGSQPGSDDGTTIEFQAP